MLVRFISRVILAKLHLLLSDISSRQHISRLRVKTEELRRHVLSCIISGRRFQKFSSGDALYRYIFFLSFIYVRSGLCLECGGV